MGNLNKFNIQQLIDKFNLKTFIESGTLYGDTVSHYKDQFKTLHSIEIDKELADRASFRFHEIPHIKIWCGNSYEVLPQILTLTKNNALFFLDGHFPGADAHKCAYDSEKDIDKRLPLEKELQTIRQHCERYQDVVIIDDVWIYEESQYEWGTFNEHSKRCNHNVTREEITQGKNSDFIYKAFEGLPYEHQKVFADQGYLIFYPQNFNK